MTHVPESLSSRRTVSERALADAFPDRGAAPSMQDVFLNSARRERLAVTLHLMTGQSFDARIKGFDRFAVVVDVERRRSSGLQARHRVHRDGARRRRLRRAASLTRGAPPPAIQAARACQGFSDHTCPRAVSPEPSCIVIDSAGIGELPDAAAYGDEGSNTLGNIAPRGRPGACRILRVARPRTASSPLDGGAGGAARPARRLRPHGGGVAGQGLGDRPLGDGRGSCSTGRSRPFPTAFRRTSSRSSSAASGAGRSATWSRRAPRSSIGWATSTCGPASRSSTPRPTACSRSPRTRT